MKIVQMAKEEEKYEEIRSEVERNEGKEEGR